MSMQLRVTHTTGFAYDGKAVASYNQARLTPVTTVDQIVVHSRVEVSPKPWVYEYRDYFGNHVTAFEVLDPHDAMTVTAVSTVQTYQTEHAAVERTTTWEGLAVPEVEDRWTEYLTLPETVAPPADLRRRVERVREQSATPDEAARAVCALVNDEIEHLGSGTDAHAVAGEAWAQRAGAPRDMVHLAIGALRSMRIPARYVSGYRHAAEAPAVGESCTVESHAWVEWWDAGWHGLDLATLTAPDDRYVVLATGREYADVRPLSGIYSGSETSAMTVEVEITRLS